MKNIFITTYHTWKSYGAVLQAVALNNFLRKYGYNAQTIDYQVKINSKSKFNLRRKLQKMVMFYQDAIKKRKTNDFIKENLVKTREMSEYSELCGLNAPNSYFVAGSDQIWHPERCFDFFFLRFVEKEKRISYAASMGSLKIPDENRERFKEYINGFTYISVREKSMLPVLGELTDKQCRIHIDPTLLMDREYWESRERQYKVKKPYILLYSLYWDERYNVFLKELHRKTGYEIISLSPSRRIFCTKRVLNADPGQFLYLIHHAESVITSSFHGTIFSLLYRKSLRVIVNPNAPARIMDLLSKFGFEKVVAELGCNDVVMPDYSEFEAKLDIERERSRQYFFEVLGESNDKNR